ncbi:MAG: tetratricopeptide repeat protein [Candidatus Acidiferrum sp.]
MWSSRSSFLLAVLALLSPGVIFSKSPSPPDASLSAAGTVVLSGDDRPVRRARVELFQEDSGPAMSTFTDDNGKFHFAELFPATYRITVTAPACETFQLTASLPAAEPLVLRLRKSTHSPTPRDNSVVSVQDLAMPGKTKRAFEKGTDLLVKGEAEASVPYFRNVIEEVPSSYRAHHNLALALYQLGQLDAAAEEFQKSVDLTSGGFGPSFFGLSMILYQRSDFRHAESVIERGLLAAPYSSVGKYCLALAQYSLGRFSDAERTAMDVVKLDSEEADVHVLLARIHELHHDPHAVVAEVQAYFKRDPHGALQADALNLLHRAQQDISRVSASFN